MSGFTPAAHMDILKELRLRRWARENYVSIDERQSKWHPIVLEEMLRKDEELHAARASDSGMSAFAASPSNEWEEADPGSRIVPLLPAPLRVDPPHLGPTVPHFLSRPINETVSEEADWGFYLG